MAKTQQLILPIKGKPGRYFDFKTGQEISRRQRDKILLGSEHVSKINKASRARAKTGELAPKMAKYNTMVQHYKATEAEKLGISLKAVKVKGNSESAKKFKELKAGIAMFGRANQAWEKHIKTDPKAFRSLPKYERFIINYYRANGYADLTTGEIEEMIHDAFRQMGFRQPEFTRYV